jgi:hypothetical protein
MAWKRMQGPLHSYFMLHSVLRLIELSPPAVFCFLGFFLVVLGFELRASHLLHRFSPTWVTEPAPSNPFLFSLPLPFGYVILPAYYLPFQSFLSLSKSKTFLWCLATFSPMKVIKQLLPTCWPSDFWVLFVCLFWEEVGNSTGVWTEGLVQAFYHLNHMPQSTFLFCFCFF